MSDFGNRPPFFTNYGVASGSTPGLISLVGNKVWSNTAAQPGTLATWKPADYTALTASTENVDIVFDISHTVTFPTGALALQRAVSIKAPTYAAVGATTISDMVTVAIDGPPAAGANVTGTKRWSQVWGTPEATNLGAGANAIGLFGAGQTQVVIRNTVNDVESCWYATTTGVNIGSTTGHGFNLTTNGAIRLAIDSVGRWSATQSVSGAGATPGWKFTGAANTGQTASTEVVDFWLNLSRAVTWTAGALTTQRFVFVDTPTVAFASASTVTTAATVAIQAAPVAGTNATITTAYSLWCQAGKAQFDGGAGFGLRADLKSYTVGTLPAAGVAGGLVYVSDAAVAACVAFSNGSNWKRCDNAATTVV